MKNTLEGKTEAMTQTSFSNEDIESACLLQDCQSERSYEYYDSPIATSNICGPHSWLKSGENAIFCLKV